MNGHNLESFVKTVLLADLRSMVYECGLLYLAYGQIAVGIEFLGACGDAYDFDQQGHSKSRFERGIADFMEKVDARYATYNKSASPYYLYKHLRCGMAHIIRPQGKIGMIGRGQAQEGGIQHLEVYPKLDKLVLVAESFYDDFEKACQILLADIPKLTHPKIKAIFLAVNQV